MSSRITFTRFVGLIVVVGALSSATAGASTTPQGLKADGLRWQGIAARYQQMQSPPAASFYTPEALKAAGLRWQAIADSYAGQKTLGSSGSGFDWGAAFIGAASMLGFAMAGAALLVATRRVRRAKIAV